MADTTRLLFIRHGESNATVEQRISGEATCTGLSDLGRQQAAALRDRFAAGHERAVDVLYSSTLARARETAEIVSPALGDLPIVERSDLVERRPGVADGMLFTDFVEQFGRPDELANPFQPIAEAGESRAEFHYRVGNGIAEIVLQHHGKTIGIACHGGVIDVVMRTFMGAPVVGLFEIWALNCALTEFSRHTDDDGKDGSWRIHRYNDAAHLAGLPPRTMQ